MSSQHRSPEFKDKSVRQAVEQDYSAAEISERPGVSSRSLYKRVTSVTPDKSERNTAELAEARSEVLRPRSQLRRTEEERDILKKAAQYFARESGYN